MDGWAKEWVEWMHKEGCIGTKGDSPEQVSAMGSDEKLYIHWKQNLLDMVIKISIPLRFAHVPAMGQVYEPT